tara:strand:+ start:406 stop:1275 length:870 start_codon:yes stop_codon:yes gene_type:complete
MDYHSDRYLDYSLLIYKKDVLISILPANRVDDQLYSHQGLTYGGFILDKKSKFNDVVEVFKTTLKYLSDNNIKTLNYKPIPSIYHILPSEESKYISHLLNSEIIKKEVLSVVRKNNLSLSKDRSNGLKKAVKNNLVVKEVNDFDDFWKTLLIPNLNLKHGVSPVHTLSEITLLKKNFNNNIRQFNVYNKEKLIAATTIFESKTTAHVQYISSDSSKNTTGSLDFLFSHLIGDVFKSKEFFDFGNSNENNGQSINKGLIYWKEGFGAKSITQDFYKVETNNYVNLDNLFI